MKRWVKRTLRMFWRAVAGLLRPVLVRVHRPLVALLRTAIQEPLPVTAELDLVLDAVVRELVRLQEKVEALERAIDESRSADACDHGAR
jgi:hypothetical protein